MMFGLDLPDGLFVLTAFLFQILLIVHFSLRRWAFGAYIMRYGWIFYALSLPAVLVSLLIYQSGRTWPLWLGGILYFVFAIFGITVEYFRKIKWRNPIRWSIFGPYITLYLATVMFYWWPLGLISRPLWYVYLVLILLSTYLNVTSHRGPQNDHLTA